jgi:anti-sigma B factor antagonist
MGAGNQLSIEVRREADRIVIQLAGELDMANAPTLQSAIEEGDIEGKPMLVLDMRDLEFIDSTGLRIILWARERCQEGDREFAITPGSQQVQRLLAVSGAGEHLRVIAAADDLLV